VKAARPLFVVVLAACSGGPGTPDAGTPDAGALDCDAYCTAVMAACTGANQQYSGPARCQNACATFDAGTLEDMTGNTLGCRLHHALAAQADAGAECEAAGPGGAGVCGSDCDGFCQLVLTYCVGPEQVFANLSTCEGACASFHTTAPYSVTDTTIQTRTQVACLLYHAQEATTVPMDHCLADLAPMGAGQTVTCHLP
jgi:hypothetical protein